uniref:type II secretion system protein GspD n=1 Tax=Phenylobacterium aquaticum TaxID=1763816 RepID=UPI0026F2861F
INNDIQAAVKALGSKTAVEVVSAPKIIALDNRTARLQIGDQVPVVVQSSQSTSSSNAALVSTVDYRSTGVILSVTPRVTGDNQVILEVSQEVSSVAKTSTSGIDSPTIQQRRFESALLLRNGGVVALGGLISSTRTTSRTGVPGLKDTPFIGALFRSDGQSQSRNELIVLLSAKILDDAAASDRALNDLAADMHELQSRGLLPTKP